MDGLQGKVALVTGGAAGIGRAIALRLAREGCDVGIVDLDAGKTKATRGSCGRSAAAPRRRSPASPTLQR